MRSFKIRTGAATAALVSAVAISALCGSAAHAAPSVALDVRAGTTGIGFDVDIGVLSRVSARIGYSTFSYDRTFDESDITYNGRLSIDNISALLDWYAFGGGFHLTVGGVGGPGINVDATGVPAADSTYTINGHTYTSGEVGSLAGRVKFGNSVSPYFGLGWGNPVGLNHHLHFLFDLGVIYGGTPNVSLAATCGPAAPAGSTLCEAVQSDVQAERQIVEGDVSLFRWYPVVNLGLAYRF